MKAYLTKSVITLNVMSLKSTVEDRQYPITCCLHETHFKCQDRYK